MLKKESAIAQQCNQLSLQQPNKVAGTMKAFTSSPNSLSDQKQNFCSEDISIFEGKRKCHYNAKYLKKKSGNYLLTALEQAKEFVKNNKLDSAEVKKQVIWGQLKPDEISKLNQFLANEKKKLKMAKSENQITSTTVEQKLTISEEQQNTIGNVQLSRNETISKELCASQIFETQVAVMLRLNRQNHLAIFDFLKSLQQEPFEKFFEVLIEVIQAVENCTQQVRLLIGLFGIYNGQKLNPGSDLCCLTLKYLAKEDGVTSQQVIGFLKFTFATNGDLHNAELSDLVEFDKRHKQCFVGFKQWLTMTFHLPHDLTLVIPNSCYILGLPFAKMLQNESNILTEHIPSEFLPLFIQILAFSFEKDEQSFLDFLNVAKNGFLDFIEKIKTTQLLNLFNGLLDEVRSHNKLWYLNICNSRRLIEGALVLVKESKVSIFDNVVCQDLLSEVTKVSEYLSVPSLIKSDASQANEGQFKQILQLNQQIRVARKFLQGFDTSQSLTDNIISNFSALQIKPHYIQELAMKIISQKKSAHCFLNIAPGLGKTKLILAAAINLFQTTQLPVFVLNSSKTLLDRDFEEANFPLDKLKIPYASVISNEKRITFSTTDNFIERKEDLPEKYHTLLDEYQNIFFKDDNFFVFVEILKQCESFTGFSGSPLSFTQKKLLGNCFDKQTLVLQLTPHTDLGDQETTICKTQKQHVKELSKIADKFRGDVPQVFILDPQTAKALIKGRTKHPYISLFEKDPKNLNNILAELFNKPNDDGVYGTFIINEEMGTGTDFKTSADIESKGGLVLVFGIQPTSTSTFEQLSCRVGRIFNKSRRLYIINDAAYVGSSQHYLGYKLKIVKQKENEEARALLSILNLDLNSENDEETISESYDANKDFKMHDENLSSVGDSDSSFESQEWEIEGAQSFKKRQRRQNNETQCVNQVNKREQKGADKLNFKKNKLLQENKEIEECKFCEKTLVDPHICKETKESFGQLQFEINQKKEIDTDDQQMLLQVNVGQGFDQVIPKQYEVMGSLSSEIGFQENFLGENSDINISEGFIQPTKDNQTVRKSSRNQRQQVEVVESNPKTRKDEVDQGYYGGYGNIIVHKNMLNDKIRVDTYENAINFSCVEGTTVLDLGSGSGILSIFAARRGAKVIAIDNADTIKFWIEEFKKLVDQTQIKHIKNTIEALKVDEIAKVDVIVSEWMGYFLFFENMVGSYIYSIKTFLKPGGTMIPSQAAMHLNVAAYDTKVNGVAKKYLRGVRKFVKIAQCVPENLVQEKSVMIYTLNFTAEDLQNPLDRGFSAEFKIVVGKEGLFNTFVGSFEVQLYEGVFLNTTPACPQTHWKQSLFFIDKPIQVVKGDTIEGTIQVNAGEENYRNLIVKFTYKVEGKCDSQGEECFTFE